MRCVYGIHFHSFLNRPIQAGGNLTRPEHRMESSVRGEDASHEAVMKLTNTKQAHISYINSITQYDTHQDSGIVDSTTPKT